MNFMFHRTTSVGCVKVHRQPQRLIALSKWSRWTIEGVQNPDRVKEEVAAGVDTLVRDRVIVTGATMAGVARSLHGSAKVPLIDGIASTVVLAEGLARMKLPKLTAGSSVKESSFALKTMDPTLLRTLKRSHRPSALVSGSGLKPEAGDCSDAECGEEVGFEAVLCRCDPVKILEAAVHALDCVPVAVEEGREAIFPDTMVLGRISTCAQRGLRPVCDQRPAGRWAGRSQPIQS
jgi:hypothetical protein